MTEWQILRGGIRALGLLFLIRAFGDVFSVTYLIVQSMTGSALLITMAAVRGVAALALIRYAPRIATMLVESEVAYDGPFDENHQWNRWLFTFVAVHALATTLLPSFFYNLRNAAIVGGEDWFDFTGIAGLVVTMAILLPLIGLAIRIVRRNPALLMGRGSYDR